jgi:hypothetical protein
MASEMPHEPKRSGWRIGLVVGVAVLLALTAAGFAAWKYLGFGPAQTEVITDSYDEAINTVEFDIHGGDIEVIGSGGDTVSVEKQLSWYGSAQPESVEKLSDGTLHISDPDCDSGAPIDCSISYTVRLPESVSVDAYTEAGQLDISGVAGELRLVTDAGDIDCVDANGPVDAQTAAGQVTITDTRSEKVAARSDAGDVEVRFVTNPKQVDASSNAGQVEVSLPDDKAVYSVDADSNVGEVAVDVEDSSSAERAITAHSDAGDVTVRYGPGR